MRNFCCSLLFLLWTIGGYAQNNSYLFVWAGDDAKTSSDFLAVAAYDMSDLVHIREVSRVTFDDKQKPRWIAAEADAHRIVLNSGEYGEHRIYMLNFDPQTGALKPDERFPDAGSHNAGVSMDGKILAAWLSGKRLSARDGFLAACGCS